MGNYENLKQSITEVIRTNGNQEITGAVLQSTLLTIISTVGANATFAGIATPTTNPGTPDQNVFYLASEAGTYTNFGGVELQGGLSVLMLNGSSWSSQQMLSIDDVPTAGSDNLVKSGGIQEELALGAVYDVSAKNPTAGTNNDGKFESLSALLEDANLDTLIPVSVRKGGMSIKFVQSSDNKYVRFNLLADEFSANAVDWLEDGGDSVVDTENFVGMKLNRTITFDSPVTTKFKFLYVNMKAGVTYNIDIRATGTSSNTNFVIGYSQSSTIAYNINSSRNLDYTPNTDVAWIWAACYTNGGTFDVTVCQKANLADMLSEVYVPESISTFKAEIGLANIYDLSDKQAISFTDGKVLSNRSDIIDLSGFSVSEELNSGIVLLKAAQLEATYRNIVIYKNGNVVSYNNFPEGTYFVYIPVSCTARICTATAYKNSCKFAAYNKGLFVSDKLKSVDENYTKLSADFDTLKEYSIDSISNIYSQIGGTQLLEFSSSGAGYLSNPTNPTSYGDFGYHLSYDLTNVYVVDIQTLGTGIAGYEGYKCFFVDDNNTILIGFNGANLVQDDTVTFNVPAGATKLLMSSLSNNNNYYHITGYTNNIAVKNKRLENVKISWYGTSIPSWGYPQLVGEMTGAVITNEAMGSSAARRGAYAYAPGASYTDDPCKVKGLPWPVSVYGLMMSVAEKNEIITNWLDYVDTFIGTYEGEQGAPTNAKPHDINDGDHEELKSILRNLCYDVRVARHCGINSQYNTGAVDVSDIYVIEHAYNDVQNIFNDISSNFNTIPDDPYDRNTPIGALNALIKYIYEHNSKATIILIGHYECQLSTGRHSKSVIEKVAEYWSLPLMKLYDLTGFNQRSITTNGYWNSSSVWKETGFTFTTDGENWTSNNIALSFGTVAGSYAGVNNNGVVTGSNATALKNLLGITEGSGNATWQPTRQMLMLTDNLHPMALSTRQYLAKLIGSWMVSLVGG